MKPHMLERRKKEKKEEIEKLFNAKDDKGWDDLHNLYVECKSLSVNPAKIFPYLNNKELIDNLSDENKLMLVDYLNKLDNEIKEHHEKLEKIYEMHNKWTGSTKTPDELMICLNIGEYYNQWVMSYQVLIMPLVNKILNILNKGEIINNHTIQDPFLNYLSKESVNESQL